MEDLLAQNLWDVLFEDSQLMPIFQERLWQPEADIYALNEQGDLVIFELKRANAGGVQCIKHFVIARRLGGSSTKSLRKCCELIEKETR